MLSKLISIIKLGSGDLLEGTTNPYNTRYLPEAKKAVEALGGIVFKGHHKVFVTNYDNEDANLRWVTTPGQM